MKPSVLRCAGFCVALVVAVDCSTTATQTKLDDVTKTFSEIVDSSTSALQAEIAAKPRVRRGEALQRFLVNPTDSTNFTLDGDQRAFANYLCAGSGALHKELAFLAFAKSYADGAAGIVKPGGDSFAGQWKKFKELEKPLAKLDSSSPSTPKSSQKLFEECVNELIVGNGGVSPLRFAGVPATDLTDEVALAAIPAAVEAFKSLFSALESAAKDGLAVINEIEARRKFTAYVKTVDQRFQAAIGTDLSSSRLDDAWNRRRAYSLWSPYLTFTRILDLKRKNVSTYEIKELAIKLEAELEEYDSLRATESPSRLVQALSTAENAVVSAATDNAVSLDAIVALLSAINSDVKKLDADYADLEKKTTSATSAAAAVFRQ